MTRAPASQRPRTRLRILAVLALAVAAGVAGMVLPAAERHPVAPAPSRPPGLDDLWNGRASLVLAHLWTSASLGAPAGGAYESAHVAVVDGTWYLFNRRRLAGACAGRAPGETPMGTQVRASPDAGRTWGAPVAMVMPTVGTPWSCAATDGDPVYDRAAGTWRLLFQCLGASGGWAGCYAERRAASPLGPFAPRRANPVIDSGALWSRICDAPTDRCARASGEAPIGDEGTFELLPAAGGGWWVSFHGYDGVHGYRGIARTASFRRGDWQLDGAGGTPRDAVLTGLDAAGWRETWQAGGPVGPGAAALYAERGWYYQLAEMPDANLGCTAGQTWDLGLFRSRSLASTRWEQYPRGNPVVYSSRAPGPGGPPAACNVQYPNLFRDPASGTTYVMYGRRSADPARDGIYVYRIAWDRNLLANGDFARADTADWLAFAGTSTQLEARRDPDGSPDGTPYLAFGCGAAACAPAASVYQDVPIPGDREGTPIAFGASLRTDAGPGRADLALIQLDAAGREIQRTTVGAGLTAAYARVRGTATLDGRTRRLRLQLYPRTPGTLRADDLVATAR